MASIDLISLYMNTPSSSLDIIRHGFYHLETMNAENGKGSAIVHMLNLSKENPGFCLSCCTRFIDNTQEIIFYGTNAELKIYEQMLDKKSTGNRSCHNSCQTEEEIF